MTKRKIAVIVGTRPEVIKMAPVVMELRNSSCIEPILLSTGQHREMLAQALSSFGLAPDEDLDLMQPGQSPVSLTARVMNGVYDYLSKSSPSAVLVQGDTTTVLASSLAAAFANIPVGHVEAGLRTGNMRSPWPEEMNRRLTSPLCRWSFAPTKESLQNLQREGISNESCFITGNTVIDALLWVSDKLNKSSIDAHEISTRLGISPEFAERYFADNESCFILVTGHRRESFGAAFDDLCNSLLKVSQAFPSVGILYPVHLNPNVREPVNRILRGQTGIELIEPVGYLDFVWLMNRCRFILSDSGGIQEEAPSLGKPVLVTRDTTERPEGVAAGTCRLVGTNPDAIFREVSLLLSDATEYDRRSKLQNPYGDGRASRRIREILEHDLCGTRQNAV
jgi:UDP-N-acetylglucosamine 2-epimerase (non-hydrolysing)